VIDAVRGSLVVVDGLAVLARRHHMKWVADLLVVDDDPDIGDMLAEVLHGEGHTVRVAHDGSEGLELLAERLPDVVLLDVEMPILTGPQMAMRMFLHDCGQEAIPIVLQSGVKNLTAIAAVVDTPYFLAKPFTLEDMFEMLERALVERVPPHPVPASPPGH
jgi:CheY-like chemotaxis protein